MTEEKTNAVGPAQVRKIHSLTIDDACMVLLFGCRFANYFSGVALM